MILFHEDVIYYETSFATVEFSRNLDVLLSAPVSFMFLSV